MRTPPDFHGPLPLAGADSGVTAAAEPVTFLLTGVDVSARLWEIAPEAAAAAVAHQRALVEAAVSGAGGSEAAITDAGGSLLAGFGSAVTAVTAALAVQRSLAEVRWPDGIAVRARIALDTGEAARSGEPAGITTRGGAPTQRCARLRDVAHGGQILLSSATAAMVGEALPDGAWLVDLGTHRLRDLSLPERVYELRHPELAAGFPPLRSLDALPNNLPAQLTSFVGRGEELAAVQRLLGEQRLVTLCGAGGGGKTRLALQAAAGVADRWPDGVWWVELGSVTDPELVATLAAATLRVLVEPASGPIQALTSQLRGRRLLVCLDTCEHLLDACAELTGALLRADPGICVLTTSREPLGVPGETVWRVPPLVEEEAVRLFAERAVLVRPGFTAGAAAEPEHPVRVICQRLDGIPLAIELAAAWVRALTPAQIAAELDDRFRLLAGGYRGVAARHRTLAASVHWSHDLLAEADRVVFRRLAVFAGGFTLGAARAVCEDADVLAVIGRLVDKSLVMVYDGEGEARYRLLDTVREYAQERLDAAGEAAAARDRHLAHFLGLAERAEPELERDQDTWRQRLEREHDNLRAALGWGLAPPDPDRGRRVAAALARFWFLHGHVREALGLLRQAIELAPDDRSTLQGRLLSALAMISIGCGQPALSDEAAERGLALAVATGDTRTRARCLAFSAYGPFYRDFPAARERSAQAQRQAEIAGDVFARDFGLLVEACTFTNEDRHQEAVARASVLVQRCQPRGERFCLVFARECEVYAALFTGDVRQAGALAAEALRIAEPLGDYFTVGHAVSNLAWVRCVAGEIDAGRRLIEPLVRSMESTPEVQIPLMAISPAKLHLAGGDLAGAVEWFERAARFAIPATDNWVVARALPGLAGALRRIGQVDQARRHAERGAAMSRRLEVPHALAEALEECGFLAAADDPARAEDLHHEALAIRVGSGLRTFYVDSMEALAGLAVGADQLDRAARLLAACEAARGVVGYPRPPVNQPDHDALVAAVQAGLGEEAFAAAWTRGAALSLDEAVAYATRARGTRGRPTRGWASLTPTELDVVRLIAEGLSNPEIAARLFMSRATVKTHLSHVYAKLGVANRTELATLASTRERSPA